MIPCAYQYNDCDQMTSDRYCTCLHDNRFVDKNGLVRACPFYKPRYRKHFCRDCVHFNFEISYCDKINRARDKNYIMCAKYEGRK